MYFAYRFLVLVSTMDGRLTALDVNSGDEAWSISTGTRPLLSSSITNLEVNITYTVCMPYSALVHTFLMKLKFITLCSKMDTQKLCVILALYTQSVECIRHICIQYTNVVSLQISVSCNLLT